MAKWDLTYRTYLEGYTAGATASGERVLNTAVQSLPDEHDKLERWASLAIGVRDGAEHAAVKTRKEVAETVRDMVAPCENVTSATAPTTTQTSPAPTPESAPTA